jgi:lysophospholipase L1-like esterase
MHFFIDGIPFSQNWLAGTERVVQINYDTASRARIREFYATADANGEIGLFSENQAVGLFTYVNGIEYEKAAEPANNATTNIVILGDSIAEGYPHYDNTYPDLLAGLLTGNSYKYSSVIRYNVANDYSVYNLGFQGQTLAELAARRASDADVRILAGATNVFMLHGGSNNLASTVAADIENYIQIICEDARTAGFDTIYAATITPRSDITGAEETKRLAVNTWLRANYTTFADVLVDLASNTVYDSPSSVNLYYSTSEAGTLETVSVHYSQLGNAVAAQMIYDVTVPPPAAAAFSIAASIDAGDPVSPTNTSTDATSYEWRVNGVLRSTASSPNLSKWMVNGSNTIQLTAAGPGGSSVASHVVAILPKVISIASPGLTHTVTGLQSGQTLVGRVRAKDDLGNYTARSNAAQATTD